MYLERSIDPILIKWSRQEAHKPLVLRGARQTGKTAAVRQLATHFDLFLELNLERFDDRTLVRQCRTPDELLAALRARHNVERFPNRTLLFLDEIQESPEAIAWLRFFFEDHPEIHVVAAGSSLETRLNQKGFSFPVGRVTFRALRPFTFFEFLGATGHDVLASQLLDGLEHKRRAPRPLHEQALDLLRDYLLVGGMPEAIVRWLDGRNPGHVRQVQADLVQALAEDIQKYGTKDVPYLEAAFENLHHHYGQRFRYENFAPGYRSQLMKDSLGKLEAALLISRVWPSSSMVPPFQTRPRSAPKLLPLDVGLALYSFGTPFEDLQQLPIDTLLDGKMAEIFVGQQLLSRHRSHPQNLHFWVTESSRNNAEIDFLVSVDGQAVPVEVKAGAAGSLKSLHQFLWKAGIERGIRLYSGEYAETRHTVRMADGNLDVRLLSVPLYLAEHLPTH